MNIEQFVILIACLAGVAAAVQFARDALRGARSRAKAPPSAGKLSRRLYAVMAAAGIVAAVALFYHLLNHDFQYSYVEHYSSRSLPVLYLISAFWAGQEGTFLFWALVASAMGWIFLRRSKPDDPLALAVISGFIAFLYLLLLRKSPFDVVVPTPVDGTGLNPLLQDPWIAIHPPILFMGYAATVVPFALVFSALVRRNYDHWVSSGFAWTLFAALSLGAGIIIGGFWAYEVLGWGGYWGWDPVENSSLVPWIVLLALVHGLVVQKAKGSLRRTNMFLALLAFLLVLYATFLTRSGVLADFSVHSFVDLGINNYLIWIMVVSVLAGLGMFFLRFRELKSPSIDTSGFNREVSLLVSLFALSAAALFTFVGMSSPILTGLIGKASQVEPSFYNNVNMPVAIVMALLLGVTPFLGWSTEGMAIVFRRLWMPLLLTALACVIASVAGVTSASLLLFVGASAFALISNVVIAFRQYRSGWTSIGGPVSHIGVALLLIGIVGSGSFDESKKVVLKQNEPRDVFGYQFTFTGMTQGEGLKPDVNIDVADGRNIFHAAPKLYYSDYNRAMMREPAIKILPLKDLYISPIDLQQTAESGAQGPAIEITKGETKDLGGYRLSFVRFEMGQHGDQGAMSVGAVLDLTIDGRAHEIVPRLVINQQNQRQMVPADLPPMHEPTKGVKPPQVAMTWMNVDQKKIGLELLGVEGATPVGGTSELLVEVSTKPLMMVVWTGVVLILVGTVIAWWKRLVAKPG